MQIRIKLMFGLAAVLFGCWAHAQTYSPPVSINIYSDGTGYAEGSLGGTQNSKNNIEYITCNVDRELVGSQESTTVNCVARDAEGQLVSCLSGDDAIARGLEGASTDAILGFNFNGAGQCTRTLVYKSSSLAPKNKKVRK